MTGATIRAAALAATALITLTGLPAAFVATVHADPAADSDSGASVEMPDVTGKTLSQAREEIEGLTSAFAISVDSINISGYPQHQYAAQMWKVCSQLPKAGKPVTAKTYVAVGVVRKNEDCGG
mgnify:CR=1 FL=1